MNHLKILGLALTILAHTNLYSQQSPASKATTGREKQATVDSLLGELPRQREDTNKVNLLYNISKEYSKLNTEEGVKYGQKCLDLATKLSWKKGIIIAYKGLGIIDANNGNYTGALKYYSTALPLAEEIDDKKNIANISENVGLAYLNLNENTRALEYFFKALKLDEEGGFSQYAAKVTGNIGVIYTRKSNFPKALEYFFKSLKLNEETGSKKGIANATSNIGMIYHREAEYAKALEYHFKSIEVYEQAGNSDRNIENVLNNIGITYLSQNNSAKALEYHFEALKLAERIGDKDGIATCLANIGPVYQQQKNYIAAIQYYQRSFTLSEELGNTYLVGVNLINTGSTYLAKMKDTAAKTNRVTAAIENSAHAYQPPASVPQGHAALLAGAIGYLERGLATGKQIEALDLIQEAYNNLSEAYRMKGDFRNAILYGDSLKVIRDSVYSQQNKETIANLVDARSEYTDSLNEASARKEAGIKAAHRRNYELIGGGAIVLSLAFAVIVIRKNKLLAKEKERSDNLLLNILPAEVAEQLKDTGKSAAKQFESVTVMFTDFVNFTKAGEGMKPEALVEELDECFKKFDEITSRYKIEKIKTIGDAYLAVCGLPSPDPKHAEHVVKAAVEINAFMADRFSKLGSDRTFAIRIGIHSGSVVAGIVGVKKFAYDIWGDTVNTAARMEQHGEAGRINISETTYNLVKDKFSCVYRGEVEAKGKGMMKMYFVG